MCQLLIYDQSHWMDKLTESDIAVRKERSVDAWVDHRAKIIAMPQESVYSDIAKRVSWDMDKDITEEVIYNGLVKHAAIVNMSSEDIEATKTKCRVHFQTKYNSRYRKGDVVEVQENGRYDLEAYQSPHFRLLQVSDMSVAEAKTKFLAADINTDHMIIRTRQFSITSCANEKRASILKANLAYEDTTYEALVTRGLA